MTTVPATTSSPQTPHPKRRPLSWRKRLGFSVVLLCAFAGFTELACHIGTMFITREPIIQIRNLRDVQQLLDQKTDLLPAEIPHPYLGWTRNPDARRPDFFEGRKYDPNEFGLMDTGSPLRKRAPGKVIIAVVGGSVGWQMTVTGEDAFLRALKRQPRFQDKEVELVRLAVSGYKQPQQLLLLTYLLSLGAEFDILVNVDGYNEVALHPGENGDAGVFAAYPRAWKAHQLNKAKPHQIRVLADYITNQARRRAWRQTCSSLPFQNSATVNFLWFVIDKRYFWTEMDLNMTLIKGRLDVPGYEVLGPPQSFRDPQEMFDYLVEYWAQCSRQIERLCQTNSIEYYHVLPPNQHLQGSKPIVDPEEIRIALLNTEASRAAGIGYPLLVKKGQQLSASGIRFHNLTQLFSQSPEPIYIDDCCHYNPTGNERLAAAVAKIVGSK